MDPIAIVDGALLPLAQATIPVDDPGLLLGWTVFETLTATAGVPDRPAAHLARLRASAEAGLVPFPGVDLLVSEVAAAAAAIGGDARVRITLTRGGHRIVAAWPADPARRHQGVRAVRRRQPREPHLGGRVKHGSRMPWAVAVARSGVDEVLLVDDAGRFTEATTAAVLAVIDGVLWAAPDDGDVLVSTTLDDLLARAASLGVEVRRARPPADGPWQGLYIASSTRDIAPVLELDGAPLTGWEAVGRRLAGLPEVP